MTKRTLVRKHGLAVLEVEIDKIQLIENPRVHPDREIEGIMESIKKYGFYAPVYISLADWTLVAGYARLEACKRLGFTKIRVIELDLKPEEYKPVMIMDNRLPELASWNYQLFIRMVEETLMGGKVELPDMGFSNEEVDNIKRWTEDISRGGAEMSQFASTVAPEPEVRGASRAEDKVVEILLICPEDIWEKNRVEIDSDLASLAMKFEGIKFSPPKVKKAKSSPGK